MEQGAVGPVADAEWSCKIHSNEGTSHVAREPWRGFHFGADRWVENIPGFFSARRDGRIHRPSMRFNLLRITSGRWLVRTPRLRPRNATP
jgi:hypothetical protein